MTHQEIEIPEDLAILNQAVDAAAAGTVTYLTRDGHRVAAVVPVELAEPAPPEPSAAVEEDDLVLSAAESRRRLDQLAREQGVPPLTDPAELRGEPMDADEAEAFSAAVRSLREPG
jgi:antitoxin (DNA-binding transcriptional repressor) of toxin-antitoxin stability system